MKIEQKIFSNNNWRIIKAFEEKVEPQLVFVFAGSKLITSEIVSINLKEMYPSAIIVGCSTAGEIATSFVENNSIVTTAIYFEKSYIKVQGIEIASTEKSFDVGEALIKIIPKENLRHIVVLSEGLKVNGTQLVNGMLTALPEGVNITGGLAGDGSDFLKTYILCNQGIVSDSKIVAISFYGDDLKVGYGSIGGWDIFGIERLVTKSKNNVLYEIDNSPALALYKSFLGDLSNELPSSALLFPLSLRENNFDQPVVRTILAVNEEEQSLTFAGDIPQGSHVKLMKANNDRLIEGAENAAKISMIGMENIEPEFALLVSCVGRKLVLKQLIDEEVEAVQNYLGNDTVVAGFYSYGEISPFSKNTKCELHNQTMTVTVFSEK